MGLAGKIKKRIGEEAHYMKLGAKVLPSVAAKKIKEGAKGYWENVKENARLQAQADKEAKLAEQQAYRETLLKEARARGTARGTKRASGHGVGGILQQLGEAGERMSTTSMLGIELGDGADTSPASFLMSGFGDRGKKGKQGSSPSDYMFSGLGNLGQPQKQRDIKIVHHVHHYPRRKKRRG